MQREISKSAKKTIIKNHLQGLNQNENLKSVNSSTGGNLTLEEVNSVIEEFGAEASRDGLDKTAKDYGVANVAKELGDLARFRRENKVEYSAMIEGGRIANTLKKFGAAMPEFEEFLSSVYARALEKGYTPKEIIAQSAKLAALEKKYGTKYDDLVAEFDNIGREVSVRKKEKSAIDLEISNVAKKKSDLLAKNSLDEQKIADFARTKQELTTLGLEVSSLASVRNFLVAVKNEKFDAKSIIEKLNSISDLSGQRSKAEQELERTRKELEEKKTLLAEVQKLEGSKLQIDQIERLRGVVNRISVDNKIDPAQAFSRFEQDVLLNYNSVLGLRPETARLEESKKKIELEIEAKRKEIDSAQFASLEKIKKLEEKYAKQKAEIEAYNELRAQGIDAKRIVTWSEIMKKADLDFATVESELRNQGNLKSLEDRASSRVKELLAEELKLTTSIASLRKEKESAEASISAIRESALAEIEAARSKIVSSISTLNEEASSKISEALEQNQKVLEAARSSSSEEMKRITEESVGEIKSATSDLKTSASEFTRELKTLVEQAGPEIKNVGQALDAGEKIGKYRNILPLLQLMDGSSHSDDSEAMIAMWNLTSRFNAWLESHYPAKKEISEPLAKLIESINDEIQKVGGGGNS